MMIAVVFSFVGARAIQIQVFNGKETAAQAAEKMTVARDVPAVAREVARALRPDAQLAVLQADICRSDLLVEMEALALLR